MIVMVTVFTLPLCVILERMEPQHNRKKYDGSHGSEPNTNKTDALLISLLDHLRRSSTEFQLM